MADYGYTFTGADNDPWEAGWAFSGGTPEIENNRGRTHSDGGLVQVYAVRTGNTVAESDQLAWFSGPVESGGNEGGAGLLARYASTSARYRFRIFKDLEMWKDGTRVGFVAVTVPAAFWLRLRLTDEGSDTRLQGRFWADVDPEPSTWDIDFLDTSPPRASGECGLYLLAQSDAPTIQVDDYTLDDLNAGGTGPKEASGGSTTVVTVTATGAGTKTTAGGSGATVTADTTGSGHKVAQGGSQTGATATTSGAGAKTGTGGSQADVTATATGGGHRVSAGSGGSTATVTATTTGAGAKAARGGSTVHTTATSTGAGTKTGRGGTAALATVTTSGGGHNPGGPPGGGSVALVTVGATGGGVAHRAGGSTSTVHVTTTGAGVKTSRGGSVALTTVAVTGGGHNPDTIAHYDLTAGAPKSTSTAGAPRPTPVTVGAARAHSTSSGAPQ